MKINRLTQIVNKQTRATPLSNNLLEVILTIKPNIITSHDVVSDIIALHDLITTRVKISKLKHISIPKALYHLSIYIRDALFFPLNST